MASHKLSPDELDLTPEELSNDDMKAFVESIENHPDSIAELIDTLSEAQKSVLRVVHDRNSTHSGRGGWQVSTMRALEKKGCVTQGKKSLWETHWSLTTLGKTAGRTLHEQWVKKYHGKEGT